MKKIIFVLAALAIAGAAWAGLQKANVPARIKATFKALYAKNKKEKRHLESEEYNAALHRQGRKMQEFYN